MITTPTHVFFYGGVHYSNWHGDGTTQFVDPTTGIPFHTSEHAMMWQKARFFNDAAAMAAIAAHSAVGGHPREVKAMGRTIKGFSKPAWDIVGESLVAYVVWLKYSQNAAWGTELKATEDRILIEASPVDFIWGVGMDVNAAAAHVQPGARDEVVWPGRNLLGKALMTVRGLL